MATLPGPMPVWMQQSHSAVSTRSNKDVAMELALLAIRIFPCKLDRTPAIKGWEAAATYDVSLVSSWRDETLPGLPAGIQGLVVIDCDRHADGADGVSAFESLCATLAIDLSAAFIVETPNHGRHFYFTTGGRAWTNSNALPDGVDVRGVGGYVIAPGVTLPDGRAYRIVRGSWATIPPLPAALVPFLKERGSPTAPPPPSEAEPQPIACVATPDDLAYFRKAFEDERRGYRLLSAGRNEAMVPLARFAGNFILHYGLDRDKLEAELHSDMVANGYVALHGDRTAWTTIQHNVSEGMREPRALKSQESQALRASVDLSAVNHPATPARNMTLESFAGIQEQPITWLWDGYLPLGKLTLLAGAGGTGKSTIAFSFAAIITTAGTWPDGTQCKQAGNVVIWSSEDDPADTIKPRLMAMGADTSRCFNIPPFEDQTGTKLPFDPARDMNRLRDAVRELGGIALFIIDPIVSAVTGDMHKANDVRRSLQTIVDFAAECHCAVVGITHFAKGTAGKNSAERVIGSQAFSAFARMVLVAAKEEDSEHRVFTRAKSNNSVDTGGYSYSIEPIEIKPGLVATRVAWGDPLEGSSRDILANVEGEPQAVDVSAIGRAKAFLQQQLAGGPVPAKQLLEQAKEQANTSEKTLRRAKDELGIVAKKGGFDLGWTWELPYDLVALTTMTATKGGHVPWTQ